MDASEETKTQEVEKVKVGEKEYTQDELSHLVGLGEVGAELESKWNTKIDRLYPEFTKATQEREDLRKQVEGFKNQPTGEELSTEENRKLIRQQLKDALGDEIVLKSELSQEINNGVFNG